MLHGAGAVIISARKLQRNASDGVTVSTLSVTEIACLFEHARGAIR